MEILQLLEISNKEKCTESSIILELMYIKALIKPTNQYMEYLKRNGSINYSQILEFYCNAINHVNRLEENRRMIIACRKIGHQKSDTFSKELKGTLYYCIMCPWQSDILHER